MTPTSANSISQVEIDILLLFYTFSDEHGNVNARQASQWAYKVLGVIVPMEPFKITQHHLNILMDSGAIPDIRKYMPTLAGKRAA